MGASRRHESESEVAQSCPTLCKPMDCSPPGSSVHGFSRQEYWSGLPFPSPGFGTFLQWPGLVPGCGTKILQAEQQSQKKLRMIYSLVTA